MDGAHTRRFVFNINPFALMTQHPAEVSRLPKQLREMLPERERSNRQLMRLSKEIVDMAFQMFWRAMGPLRDAGKLGMLAFQFPNLLDRPDVFGRHLVRVGFGFLTFQVSTCCNR